jgi:hypothetical protein
MVTVLLVVQAVVAVAPTAVKVAVSVVQETQVDTIRQKEPLVVLTLVVLEWVVVVLPLLVRRLVVRELQTLLLEHLSPMPAVVMVHPQPRTLETVETVVLLDSRVLL